MQIQPENLVNQAPEKNTPEEMRKALQVELAAETLQRFGELRFMARGGSMLPAIYPGDWLTIKRDMGRTIRCGEVVLCLRNGVLFVHRVEGIVERGQEKLYVLRGDALSANDPPVDERTILGQVVSVERRGKTLDPNKHSGIGPRMMAVLIRNFGIAARIMVHCNNMRSANYARKRSLETRHGTEGVECL